MAEVEVIARGHRVWLDPDLAGQTRIEHRGGVPPLLYVRCLCGWWQGPHEGKVAGDLGAAHLRNVNLLEVPDVFVARVLPPRAAQQLRAPLARAGTFPDFPPVHSLR